MLTDLDSRDENELDEVVLIDHHTNKKSTRESKRPVLYFIIVLAFCAAGIWIGTKFQGGQGTSRDGLSTLALGDVSPISSGVLLENGSIDRPVVDTFGISSERVPEHIKVVDGVIPDKARTNNKAILREREGFEKIANTVSASNEKNIGKESVSDLLISAEQAFRENRLTLPAQGSAFSLYQKILYSNPRNVEARIGIRNIAERYIALADDLYLRGEWDRAQNYDIKASFVASFYPEVESWLSGVIRPSSSQINRASTKEGESEVVDVRKDSKGNRNKSSVTNNDGPIVQNTPEEFISQSDSEPSIKVERSKHADEVKRIQKAKSFLAKSNLQLAETELLNAKIAFPESNEIKRLLFTIYIDSNRQTLARQMLSSMRGVTAYDAAFLQSRVLVSENNNVAAIELLERFSPNVYEAADFYRFLAALYQKQGRYSESANQYRQLISVDDKQVTYWLGLAVSLDALSDERGALRAFQWVRQYGIADLETRAYVDQRIQSLSS